MTADLTNIEFRLVGPFRGGRVGAVAGDPSDRLVFYFGSTGGGVWKTTDGGVFWENVSDGFFQRASVGAIAVAQADPNVLYVGMGESCIRGNVAHGDGVYRSTNAGKTWTHLGLAETRHISKVRVHPRDPDTVYVAALGHAHGPHHERGIYRSTDGGKTWNQVLFHSQDAGANDLSMDPCNPRILYAAIWETRRYPWTLNSGGSGSGLWKSTDGGDTWTDISRNKGLPKTGVFGKIGIAASGAQAGRVYAIVEHEHGGVFRSDDGGETWEKGSEERKLRQRAWYYQHVIADPREPQTVWALNVETFKSTDGGLTFAAFPTPHGDNHELWIDPNDTRRMIQGNDGGATITFNGGATWSSLYNQPTAEFYHVTTDTRTPYRIHGAQQDNTTLSLPSKSPLAAITHADAWEIGGGESGYVAVRPDNPDIIYAGSYLGYMTRYDHRTGQARNIEVWPDDTMGGGASDAKYRFQWTFPIVLSPHDPNVLYATGNHVFRSTDEGMTWESISPDLTRDDATKQESSGGPITKDNTGAEYYGTIFAFAESRVERGVFWAGSDDGLVHVSRDAGKTWQNVTPRGLPEWALISIIEASPHHGGTAFVAATRYKLDDFAPYLFRTADYGASWTRINTNLPENVFTRVIREDPTRPGLLYAGTETGVYVSFDDGGNWHALKGNLPVVPIHDLVVHEPEGDLVLATHGRSFWVLDDLGPVRAAAADPSTVLTQPRPVVKYATNEGFGHRPTRGRNYRFTGPLIVPYHQVEDSRTGDTREEYYDAGKNPPRGAIIHYFLETKPEDDITLTFSHLDGTEIRTLSSRNPEDELDEEKRKAETKKHKEPRIPKEAGLNRFVWNLRGPDATRIEDDDFANEVVEGALSAPAVPPGTYRVTLRAAAREYAQEFSVQKDPRVAASDADLQAQYAMLRDLHQTLSSVNKAINELRAIRKRAEDWASRSKDNAEFEAIARGAQAVIERIEPIEEELIQAHWKARGDELIFPARLNAKLAALIGRVASGDTTPTAGERAVAAELFERVQKQLDQYSETVVTEVANLNEAIRRSALGAVAP